MIYKMLEDIKSKYECTPVDAGVFAKLTIQGAKTVIQAYDVAGVGRVALAEMTQLFGLVRMQTLIINPMEKDMPIYHVNRHIAKGNDFFRVEVFDTQMNPLEMTALEAVNVKYPSIPDEPQNERWYDDMKLTSMVKKMKKNRKEEMDALIQEHFHVYMDMLAKADDCKRSQKKKKASIFVDALVQQSGFPLIEVFIGNYGTQITQKLCNEVLFGLK